MTPGVFVAGAADAAEAATAVGGGDVRRVLNPNLLYRLFALIFLLLGLLFPVAFVVGVVVVVVVVVAVVSFPL